MAINLSDLYKKKIMTLSGRVIGSVEEIIIDSEEGGISHFLLKRFDEFSRSDNPRGTVAKSSVLYKRVKSIGETIIVSDS
jgi:sporulation protein YlmC with PRC-barrel domain